MTRGRLPALLLAIALSPVAARTFAADTIGPADFETLTTGRTLSFALNGGHYGAEQYLPDRKVIWRLGDGGCVEGEWFAREESICFVYDAIDGAQCWRFTRRERRIHASSLTGGMDLEVTGTSAAPLDCPAPDMGV